MQPVSEEPIKLVHVLNPGEREYLSPNLIGVQNIAMTFLPLSMNFINIADAYREIVNGVKYDLLVNAVDTKENDAEIVCHMIILEKPWLRTEWGDKVRELQHSNCSTTAMEDEDIAGNPAARANAINDKYVKSSLFNGGSRNELSADEMKRLEDQIFPSAISSKRKSSFNNLRIQDSENVDSETSTTTNEETQSTAAATPVTSTTTSSIADGEDSATSNENNAAEKPTDEEETTVETKANDEDQITSTSIMEPSTESSTSNSDDSPADVPELSEDDKKWLDDIFSVGALNFENTLNARRASKAHESLDDDDDFGQQQQVKHTYTLLLLITATLCCSPCLTSCPSPSPSPWPYHEYG